MMSEAFDTILHNILSEKIKYYGFNQNYVNLFKFYPAHRMYAVYCNGSSYSMLPVTTGVPIRIHFRPNYIYFL